MFSEVGPQGLESDTLGLGYHSSEILDSLGREMFMLTGSAVRLMVCEGKKEHNGEGIVLETGRYADAESSNKDGGFDSTCLKAFHHNGCEYDRTMVNEAAVQRLLCHRDNDRCLKAHWDDGAAHQDVQKSCDRAPGQQVERCVVLCLKPGLEVIQRFWTGGVTGDDLQLLALPHVSGVSVVLKVAVLLSLMHFHDHPWPLVGASDEGLRDSRIISTLPVVMAIVNTAAAGYSLHVSVRALKNSKG